MGTRKLGEYKCGCDKNAELASTLRGKRRERYEGTKLDSPTKSRFLTYLTVPLVPKRVDGLKEHKRGNRKESCNFRCQYFAAG